MSKKTTKKTTSKFIGVIKSSKVDMKEVVTKLSAQAYRVLSYLYYRHIDGDKLKISEAIKILQISKTTYSNCLYELKENNLLYIQQIDTTTYLYMIGEEIICKYKAKWKNKEDYDYKELVKEYFEMIGKVESKVAKEKWETIIYDKSAEDWCPIK
jgi:DNA-binding MarR family transcriptional regulator